MPFRPCRTSCDSEVKFLKTFVNNDDNKLIIRQIKNSLNKLMHSMKKIGINYSEMLSNKVLSGSIGSTKPRKKIAYLLSNKSNIREKMHAIFNYTQGDGIKKKLPTAQKLYKYIMTHKKLKCCKDSYENIQTVTNNLHPEKLDTNDETISKLWCPMVYLYPNYVYKKDMMMENVPKNCKPKLYKKYLIEELSENEKEFLKENNIDVDKSTLPILTGRNFYGNVACNIKTLPKKKYVCRISGISGTALLFFTLGKILNINWEHLFFALLIYMVSTDHGISEICEAATQFGYMPLFKNHKDMIKYIRKMIKEMKGK